MTNPEREILAYCSDHFEVSVDTLVLKLSHIPPHLVRERAMALIFDGFLNADVQAKDLMEGSLITPGYIMGLTPAGHAALHPPKAIGFG